MSLAALFARKRKHHSPRESSGDTEVIRLTVKAEIILAELDTVVKEISTMLREQP